MWYAVYGILLKIAVFKKNGRSNTEFCSCPIISDRPIMAHLVEPAWPSISTCSVKLCILGHSAWIHLWGFLKPPHINDHEIVPPQQSPPKRKTYLGPKLDQGIVKGSRMMAKSYLKHWGYLKTIPGTQHGMGLSHLHVALPCGIVQGSLGNLGCKSSDATVKSSKKVDSFFSI